MLNWIKKHWQILSYVFFGGLTTVVNWVIFFPLYNFAGIDANICNGLAWAGSVLFAFLTNKPFVFHSHDWHARVVMPELVKFVSSRLLSGVLEAAAVFLLVTLLGFDGNIVKLAVSVAVVIINYIASKLFVFKNRA